MTYHFVTEEIRAISGEHVNAWLPARDLNEKVAKGWELFQLVPLQYWRSAGAGVVPQTVLFAVWKVPGKWGGTL